MNKEKMIADELQHMFLEGKLHAFREEYINFIARKLRTGETSVDELIREDSELREKVLEASERIVVPMFYDKSNHNYANELKGIFH